MNINWYPGHMAKSIRMMEESLKLVDVVVELLDARIPCASKNPDIDRLAKGKKRVVVLNKADLADDSQTEAWKKFYSSSGWFVLALDSLSGKGIDRIESACRELMKEKIERQMSRGRIFVPIRAMIVGVPNVGKSTLINSYSGKSIAKTADRPGVTRGKQWIRLKKDLELLDTPGILWPKIEDNQAAICLAATGAIQDAILDMTGLSLKLINIIRQFYPGFAGNRYQISEEGTDIEILSRIGKARGFLLKGAEIDIDRAGIVVLDEFRGGKLGKITLERPKPKD
ncbi:MAG: ribosome biogenesis GTPase YlqF [Clostridiales bacterium]|nr:ribosome biogenesis GTPase YlqF [Clostridiales bacterium]